MADGEEDAVTASTADGPGPRLRALALGASRCLLVSPHLDDAVFSAGALIAERADRAVRTVVLTVFAGAPAEGSWSGLAAWFHAECGLAGRPVQRRRAEDRRALAHLGAEPQHGQLLDAIYRRSAGGWLYESVPALYGQTAPGESVAAEVSRAVADACLRLGPDLLLGPRAIGGHVDHVAVSVAVQSVGARLRIPVWLWEDQPYAVVSAGGQPRDAIGLIVSPRAWNRKIRAAREYTSQVRLLLDQDEQFWQSLTQHAMSAGGGQPAEWYWACHLPVEEQWDLPAPARLCSAPFLLSQ